MGLSLVRDVKHVVRVRVRGRGHDQRGDGDDQQKLVRVHVRDHGRDQRGEGVVQRLCSYQWRC